METHLVPGFFVIIQRLSERFRGAVWLLLDAAPVCEKLVKTL